MAEPHGTPAGPRFRVWLWRVSLALAAALVANSLNGIYAGWRQAALLERMIPGAETRMNWSGLGLVALFGIAIPGVWAAIIWRKAFPSRDRDERG